MRLRALVVTLSLPLAALAVVGPTPAAEANSVHDVGLTGFADMVVDAAHGHVFLSQGIGTVVVTDLNGFPQSTLTGLSGAQGMTLSDDGNTLWVAESDGDGLGAVDTATLAVTSLPTGAATCPESVAVTAGLVWFGYGCSSWGGIGALDPATGTTTLGIGGSVYQPELVSDPHQPNTLLVFAKGLSPGTLHVYTAAPGEPPTLTARASRAVGSNTKQVAFTPDGSQVVVASGSPYEHPVLNVSDLSSAGAYPTSAYPDAVAIDEDGVVAAGIDASGAEPDIYIFAPGADVPTTTYHLHHGYEQLLDRGLAFGRGRLFAVFADTYNDNHYRLHVLVPPTVTISTDRTTYGYGARAVVTGRLVDSQTGDELSVYAQEVGQPEQLVTTAPVDAKGRLTVRVPVTRRTTFTVRYAGTDDRPADETSTSVKVKAKIDARTVGTKRHSGKYALYPASKSAYLVATVFPNHAGGCLRFDFQIRVGRSWRGDTSRCATMTSGSQAALKLKGDPRVVGYPIRMRARFAGDTLNLAAVSPWRYAKFTRGSGRDLAPRTTSGYPAVGWSAAKVTSAVATVPPTRPGARWSSQ